MRTLLSLLLLLMIGTLPLLSGCGEDSTNPIPPDETFPPPTPVDIAVPGLPPMPIPVDNPTTREGIELGRRLFYDKRLSGDNTMSCATCHQQAFAFSDGGRQFSLGIDGILGDRNTPALTNTGFLPAFFWNGRAPTLEDQARGPVTNPIEMHTTWPEAVARLEQDPDLPGMFGRAFGSSAISEDRVVMAIAQFERTFTAPNSRYDQWRRREIDLTDAEKSGFGLFFTEVGDCFHCHDEFALSIHAFRDIGLDAVPDSGLAKVTGLAEDYGKFKIPTLRNIAVTAPYMHDGRFATLSEVLDHYNSGGERSPNLDPFIRFGQGLGLTDEQKSDIIAFLHTLTDSTFLTNPELADPLP